MTFSMVYHSLTGNTKCIATAIADALSDETMIYFGQPADHIPASDLIFAGFWTDKGSCSKEISHYLSTLSNQTIALFGTAGFGGSCEYFDIILKQVISNLSETNTLLGSFMCQGKMPSPVKMRYETMLQNNPTDYQIKALLENFYQASSHPDSGDLENAKAFARNIIRKLS